MRALVTGGAGFIGSNLVDALLDRGDEVTVVDNLATGRLENLDGARRRGIAFHEARHHATPSACARCSPGRGPTSSSTSPRRSTCASRSRTRPGTRASTSAARSTCSRRRATAGVARVVNTSTGGAIYGEVEPIPTPESVSPRPMAAYGTSKLCAETYCGWYERLYGLSTVTLRYGNVYGPRQDPLGEAGVIAIFCGRADERRRARRSTATGARRATTPTSPTSSRRTSPPPSHPEAHGVYNVGTGRECSVLEVLAALRRAADLDEDELQPEFAPARLGELQRSALDVDARAGRARASPRRPTSTPACGARSSGRARRRPPEAVAGAAARRRTSAASTGTPTRRAPTPSATAAGARCRRSQRPTTSSSSRPRSG